MVLVGGVAHVLLIIACIAGFLQPRPNTKRWVQLFAGGLSVLAYFALIVITMAPRKRRRQLDCTEPTKRARIVRAVAHKRVKIEKPTGKGIPGRLLNPARHQTFLSNSAYVTL